MIHILLVDDNPGDVLLVKDALEEHLSSHELHVVKDGGEALNFVAHMGKSGKPPCPDVVLLDLNLPKVDGPEILTEFRKNPQCAHTPVIVLTSSDAPADRARMAELGIAHYFKKPSDLDAYMQLGAVVRAIFNSECAKRNT